MSLQPQEISPVPVETARVAQAAFPRRTVAMHLRDMVGLLYKDTDCSPRGGNWRTGSVKSQAERVLGTRKRRAVVGRERRCCRKAAISVAPVRRMRVSTRLRQAAMIWGAGPLRR